MSGAWDGAGYTPEAVQTDEALFSTTFTFEWPTAPLSMNDRMHHIVKAKKVAELRALMHAKARQIPDLGRCEVRLVWFVNTRRRRDDENIVATLKPLCDGLVDAEVVPDDTREFMVKHMPEIRYEKGCTPHFEFTVTEVHA
ncbi:MAG: hypothetical protein ACRDT9_00090 [Agromyces sp.]